MRTIEHCSFATESTSALSAGVDPAVVQSLVDQDVYVCPTVSGMSFRVRERLGRQAIDVLLGRLAAMRAPG